MPFNAGQVADRLDDIIDELQRVAPQAGAAIGPNVGLLDDAREAVVALAHSNSAESARPLVRRIATDLNTLLNALAMAPLPQQAVMPVRVASMVLPAVIAAADMIWPTHT
jgi:hypothetical protein